MVDSDDDCDRRRARDKFRRERSDYQERRDDRSRRDDWAERDRGSRREYRDYDPRNRRDRYSPARHDISPPMKRMRRDWDDRGGYGDRYDNFPGSGGGPMVPPGNWGMPQNQQPREVETGLTQPPMMTFKQFLASQDDGIDDQEAVKKYNEYKLEFRRQQINEFFLNHKDEEWFRIKYHPEDSSKRKAELASSLKRRLEVFMDFFEKGVVNPIRIDQENSEQIIRFLDSVVIMLEGGTEFDLKSLDEPPEEEKKESLSLSVNLSKKSDEESKAPSKELNNTKAKKRRKTSRDSDFVDDDLSSFGSHSEPDSDDHDSDHSKKKNSKKKVKREKRSTSDSGSEKEDTVNEKEDEEEEEEENSSNKVDPSEKEETEDKEVAESDKVDKDMSDKEAEEEGEDVAVKVEVMDEVKIEDTENTNEAGDETEQEPEAPKEEKPRALHKTCSIFLRYLAPSITKQEVEAMCKRFPGFLRVAIADPQPERRFVRRAWVTFERSVNIKEMCWNLNGIRLRENELGAIVNRDLSRRIRSVNGIASHKQVVRSDIKIAAKIIQNLDKLKKLWDNEEETESSTNQGFTLESKNPLLKNITDYLIEEASAEEEELLGMSDQDENKEEEGFALERDEILIQVLDRLLLYLRVVHSVDYYNTSEYPSEDEMPNRCGIMHARGSPPSSKVTQQEINEYISHFEQKSQVFLQTPSKLSDEECVKLGKKDREVETEKFIQANTQELSKDKWLCPLSGKKFKGPEFVRKHIFNKHAEKVEEVKKEVEYFNNYLMDPKRPQLPEHPSSRPAGNRSGDMHGSGNMGHPFGGPFPPPPMHYGFGPRGPNPNFGGFGQGYGRGPDMYRSGGGGGGFGKRNYNRNLRNSDNEKNNIRTDRNPRNDPREIIGYHDLDSPQDIDYF